MTLQRPRASSLDRIALIALVVQKELILIISSSPGKMTKISTAAANGEAISRYITKDGLQGIKAISKNINK
jgi:hypothetical protein